MYYANCILNKAKSTNQFVVVRIYILRQNGVKATYQVWRVRISFPFEKDKIIKYHAKRLKKQYLFLLRSVIAVCSWPFISIVKEQLPQKRHITDIFDLSKIECHDMISL